MISFQTNIDSIVAQNNLSVNEQFQSNTIQQLTSGYRINSSGDDAAGLAVANGLRDNIAELTQGVSNANDGVAQLQIVDGGLSNISTILDRMKTLATESASGTFTGDRNTLNQEYTGLISEINRQASNINLNAGGSMNQNLSVYIGGANNAANANVNINLGGAANAVDATSLGLAGTSIAGAGGGFTGNAVNLTTPGATFVKGTAGSDDQTFTLNYVNSSGTASNMTLTVGATTGGSTLNQVLSSLNSQLSGTGITAGTDANGQLQFTGSTAFTVKDNGNNSTNATNLLTDYSAYSGSGAAQLVNSGNYSVNASTATGLGSSDTDALTFTTNSGQTINVSLNNTNGGTVADQISAINSATAAYGIYAVQSANGSGISFQSNNSFSVTDNNSTAGKGVFDNSTTGATAAVTATGPAASNAGTSAIAAINQAIQNLGLVQGSVGAGENKLQYAINLASSQISNFSTAESQIRDADVAQEAANLTKSQVLQQSSIAAMAQANQEPQALLKLLG